VLFSQIPHQPPVSETWLLTFDTACLPVKYLPTPEILQEFASQLDWINVMCYEFSLSNLKITQHNAQLYAPPDQKQANTDRGIQWFIDGGVPRDKLVLGMPLYGRAYYDTDPGPSGDGVAAKFHGKRGQYISYYPDILGGIRNGTYQQSFDLLSIGASVYDRSNRTYISYDDMHTARAKFDYTIANNLGGIMVWDLSSDDPSPASSILYLAGRMLPNIDRSPARKVRFVAESKFCNVNGTVKLKQLAGLYGGSGSGRYAEWSSCTRSSTISYLMLSVLLLLI
jgi:GH18 family chitinase